MDFSAYPNLIKYLPNWLERFYPNIAHFARGEGYPCGNQGVFIPRRNRCWTHPKTGQKMKKPLTYQMYKEAKEKSQRSKTEKGRTALDSREQSFRDKAREKVKGWQKNKPQESKSPIDDNREKLLKIIQSDELNKNLANQAYNDYQRGRSGMSSRAVASNYDIPHATAVARINALKESVGLSRSSSPSLDKELGQKIDEVFKKNKPQGEVKATSNSSDKSEKVITKSVDQKYKDIIASSKDPGGTGYVLSAALQGNLNDFEKKRHNEYLTAINSKTVPKGMELYYRQQIDKYKPVIEAESFINERRKKAIAGDYETKEEAGAYVLNKLKEKGYKEHEYYDSPDYVKDYDKLKDVMKSDKLPPPLSGVVPIKELRQTIKQGDKLFYKKDTYSLMSGGSSPTGYQIADAGEVLKVSVKNVKTRSKGEYMGKPSESEGSVPLDKISHIIRDGKRYKVDDSDDSPNDLGISESSKPKAKSTRVKSAGGKSKNEVPYTNPLGYQNSPLDKFDKSLDREVEKLEPTVKNISIQTEKGRSTVPVTDYGNGLAVWKNKNKKNEDVYTVIHASTGKRLSAYDSIEEDQSKRIVAGLTALGVDWTKEEKEIAKDGRLKDLNGLMHSVLDSNYRRFKIADKERLEKLRKVRDEQDKKDNFNAHLNLTQFGSDDARRVATHRPLTRSQLTLANFGGIKCCCANKPPLKRRKTKTKFKRGMMRRAGGNYG